MLASSCYFLESFNCILRIHFAWGKLGPIWGLQNFWCSSFAFFSWYRHNFGSELVLLPLNLAIPFASVLSRLRHMIHQWMGTDIPPTHLLLLYMADIPNGNILLLHLLSSYNCAVFAHCRPPHLLFQMTIQHIALMVTSYHSVRHSPHHTSIACKLPLSLHFRLFLPYFTHWAMFTSYIFSSVIRVTTSRNSFLPAISHPRVQGARARLTARWFSMGFTYDKIGGEPRKTSRGRGPASISAVTYTIRPNMAAHNVLTACTMTPNAFMLRTDSCPWCNFSRIMQYFWRFSSPSWRC